jgi:hypothetical protein
MMNDEVNPDAVSPYDGDDVHSSLGVSSFVIAKHLSSQL